MAFFRLEEPVLCCCAFYYQILLYEMVLVAVQFVSNLLYLSEEDKIDYCFSLVSMPLSLTVMNVGQ